MSENLILIVASSPRKNANTDILVNRAMEALNEYDPLRAELIQLRDYEIAPCNSCVLCCSEVAAKNGGNRACLSFKDGMDEIYPKLLECQGLILASPVYFGAINAQMKAFMDRTEGLLRYGMSKYKNALSGKVGGGIVVGGNRNGGEEFTLQQMHHYFAIQDMTIVGSGPEPIPGCYLGGCGVTYPKRGRVKNAVLDDELGMKSAANVARRVAETVIRLNK